jgi:hypothetical protein
MIIDLLRADSSSRMRQLQQFDRTDMRRCSRGSLIRPCDGWARCRTNDECRCGPDKIGAAMRLRKFSYL